MNTLTADTLMEAALGALSGPTEIRDAHGQVLGYFTPALPPELRIRTPEEERLYAEAKEILDPQELERRKARNEPGISTATLLAKLQQLES